MCTPVMVGGRSGERGRVGRGLEAGEVRWSLVDHPYEADGTLDPAQPATYPTLPMRRYSTNKAALYSSRKGNQLTRN